MIYSQYIFIYILLNVYYLLEWKSQSSFFSFASDLNLTDVMWALQVSLRSRNS